MKVSVFNGALYVVLKRASEDRDALGFVFKWRGPQMFSERYGKYKRALKLGRFYFRTYARAD